LNRLFGVATLLCFVATVGIVDAKTCRDAHGKFTKCVTATPAPSKHCRDAHGKFTKCTSK